MKSRAVRPRSMTTESAPITTRRSLPSRRGGDGFGGFDGMAVDGRAAERFVVGVGRGPDPGGQDGEDALVGGQVDDQVGDDLGGLAARFGRRGLQEDGEEGIEPALGVGAFQVVLGGGVTVVDAGFVPVGAELGVDELIEDASSARRRRAIRSRRGVPSPGRSPGSGGRRGSRGCADWCHRCRPRRRGAPSRSRPSSNNL